MLLTLPGTPTTYQGEEIAMTDVELTFEESTDPWGLNFGPVSKMLSLTNRLPFT